MSAINVALLQMSSCGTDQEANLVKGERFCRKAREMGADVALFPEMWNRSHRYGLLTSLEVDEPFNRATPRARRTTGRSGSASGFSAGPLASGLCIMPPVAACS